MYIGGSIFRNNTGLYGGAIRSVNSDLFIDGCLFEYNTAMKGSSGSDEGRGGALHVEDAADDCQTGRNTIRLMNSVLVRNK